jgi:hypothetical protein
VRDRDQRHGALPHALAMHVGHADPMKTRFPALMRFIAAAAGTSFLRYVSRQPVVMLPLRLLRTDTAQAARTDHIHQVFGRETPHEVRKRGMHRRPP